MITRIEAHNYRCFAQLAVDLGGYHVLAGANGSGKTTLLEIPPLLGDLLRAQRVADAFLRPTVPGDVARAGSVDELVHRGRGNDIVFAVEARLPVDVAEPFSAMSVPSSRRPSPTHLRYEVRLETLNYELSVAEEYLFLFSEDAHPPQAGVPLQGQYAGGRTLPGSRWRPVIRRTRPRDTAYRAETTTRQVRLPGLRIDPNQLALASVPADPSLFPAARWLNDLLRGDVLYYEPKWSELREPALPGEPNRLQRDGRNLPWLALNLLRDDRDGFRFWVDHVRTALPQVADIEVRERPDDHRAYFIVEYAGGHRVPLPGLSDGTLRILTLSMLNYLPPSALPSVLAVEEPENGLHPQAIDTVLISLRSLRDSQVWISTHSPIVLAETELADVLAMRMDDDGAVLVTPGNDHPRLKDWQGGIDLGSLFASGVLS